MINRSNRSRFREIHRKLRTCSTYNKTTNTNKSLNDINKDEYKFLVNRSKIRSSILKELDGSRITALPYNRFISDLAVVEAIAFKYSNHCIWAKCIKDDKIIVLSGTDCRMVLIGDKIKCRMICYTNKSISLAKFVECLDSNSHELIARINSFEGSSYALCEDGVNDHYSKIIIEEIKRVPGSKKKPRQGDLIILKITNRASRLFKPTGKILRVLDNSNLNAIEMHKTLNKFRIITEYSKEALELAKKLNKPVDKEAVKSKVDFTDLAFVTIDGVDAKDFDDAVYCKSGANNSYTLYVAISDVSHYIKPGSALDKESYERATSTYFPRSVVPMLPFDLSNGVLSIKPKLDRLALVCEMLIDKHGTVQSYKFCEATIKSRARLEYFKLSDTLDENYEGDNKYHLNGSVKASLISLKQLANILLISRSARGALNFESSDVAMVFGANDEVKDLIVHSRSIAHIMIEEAMLAANVSAAKLMTEHGDEIILRAHEEPDKSKLDDLLERLKEFRINIPKSNKETLDVSLILDILSERSDYSFWSVFVLRMLKRAYYTKRRIGHFGLAYNEYTHFTSPIRRYPDIVVHRIIKDLIYNNKTKFKFDEELAIHCSEREKASELASMSMYLWYKLQYIQRYINEEYEGILVGIEEFGVFIRINKYSVDGMVHISKIRARSGSVNKESETINIDQSSYRLGSSIKVKISDIDLPNKRIALDII